MKAIKLVGCAGIAIAAAVFSTSSVTLGESPSSAQQGGIANHSGSQSHRIIYNLAAQEQYTAGVASGNKWGAVKSESSKASGSSPSDVRGGYKWGQAGSRWGRASNFEQAGSRWGRASSFEQAGSRWGRASNFEQAGSRWGRASSFEQAGSRWGRASSFEQAGSRWGRASEISERQ
jgi:hypothetical protein